MRDPYINIPLKTNFSLPALTENSGLRYFNFIALYIAQGIPEGMTLFGIPAWLAMHGKTPGEIGSFIAVFMIPWSFKIITAPLMDRFSYLPMGRRRPWILFGQLGLIASFISLAFVPEPLNNMKLLMAAAFAVGFFGAFQDVATDGMAIDIVPVTQQARANGFMWGAKIMGTSASLALGSWMINKYGFSTAMLVLCSIVCLIMLVPVLLRERPDEKLLPWTKGCTSPETKQMQVSSWRAIFQSLYKVVKLHNSMVFLIFLFIISAACNYIDTIMSIFTVQALGWTDQAYSGYYATATLAGGMGGMLIGGILIDRFGRKKMLNIYMVLLLVLVSAFAFSKAHWAQTSFVFAFMITYQVLYVFSVIGLFATAMQCCWKKISATQFTLYMAISNIGRTFGAKLIGPLKENLNWEYTLFAFSIMLVLAWIAFQFMHIEKQRHAVAEIEAQDMALTQISMRIIKIKANS